MGSRLRVTFPPDEKRQATGGGNRQHQDNRIGEPIVALATAEDDLHRRDPANQEQQPGDIKRSRGFSSPYIGEKGDHHYQCGESERYVEEENISPGIPLGQEAADESAGGSGEYHNSKYKYEKGLQTNLSVVGTRDRRLCSRQEGSAGEAHEAAKDEDLRQRVAHSAANRRAHEEHDRAGHPAAISDFVCHPIAENQADQEAG